MHKHILIDNSEGFVAIFATIIIMIVLGILIISFSTISNREVNTASNRELSVQASYTSQSGINDVYSIIRQANGAVIDQTHSCTKTGSSGAGPDVYNKSTVLVPSVATSSKYTCVLVYNTPTNLTYECSLGGGVCPNNSIISLLENSGSSPISSINIQWSDDPSAGQTCSANSTSFGVFPTYKNWPCLPELLRVDLVPFNSGSTTLNDIATLAKTFFVYPSLSVSQTCPVAVPSQPCTPSFSNLPNSNSISNSNYLAQAECTNLSCKYSVDGLSGNSSYYIRIQYYYNQDDSSNFYLNGPTITINGMTTTGGNVEFDNSQVEVDVTGYANGVEERTSSTLSLQNSVSGSTPTLPLPPNYAIQSTDSLCKSLILAGNTGIEENIDSGSSIPTEILNNSSTGSINTSIEKDADPCNPI